MIKIYSRPKCGECIRAKDYLDEKKILYQVVDVTKKDFDNVKEKVYSVPTIEIKGKRVYSVKELEEMYGKI